MGPKLEETIYVDFVTSSSTGAAVDADSTPTAEVFEDATDTAIITPTVVKRTGKTGNYRIPVACTAANGFEAGKSYNVVASATVGGVAAKAVVATFQVRARSVDDVLVTAGYTAPDNTTIGLIYGVVDTEVAAIKAKTDNLPASFPTNFAALLISAGGLAAIDTTRTFAVRNQDAITAPTIADALQGGWSAAFAKEAGANNSTAFAVRLPDDSGPARTFTLDAALASGPFSRS
jgi:hypothetical protein